MRYDENKEKDTKSDLRTFKSFYQIQNDKLEKQKQSLLELKKLQTERLRQVRALNRTG